MWGEKEGVIFSGVSESKMCNIYFLNLDLLVTRLDVVLLQAESGRSKLDQLREQLDTGPDLGQCTLTAGHRT